MGYNLGKKYEDYLSFEFIRRMLPYVPLEIRRGLESHDYRYIYMFNNIKEKNRVLFDTETGKALS